jgi:hypothetical protein
MCLLDLPCEHMLNSQAMHLFDQNLDIHDPGGQVQRSLLPSVAGSAIFGGPMKVYRYALHRQWDDSLPAVMFVMLNPSTATEGMDDPTIWRCQDFARRWGYGSLFVGNVFAYRTTNPRNLMRAHDPVGPDNDHHLLDMASHSRFIVLAHGKLHRTFKSRGEHVVRLFRQQGYALHALCLNADGTPRHPLYVSGRARPRII